MTSQRSRRRFLGLAGASAALAIGASRSGGQEAGKADKPKTFTGTSNKGSLQEAIELAIQAALKSAPAAVGNRQVRWALKETTGVFGTNRIVMNSLTATIAVV